MPYDPETSVDQYADEVIDSEEGLRSRELVPFQSRSMTSIHIPEPEETPEMFRELSKFGSFDEFKRQQAMWSSYYRVPTMSFKEYMDTEGRIVEVIGCVIHPGIVFNKADGSGYKQGSPLVLLKTTQDVKRGNFIFKRVLHTTAIDIMDMAVNVWIPCLGSGDWEGMIPFYIHATGKGRLSMQDISDSYSVPQRQ